MERLKMTETEMDTDLGIGCPDFPHICRVCLKMKTDELVPIFNSVVMQENIQIEQLLKDCAKIVVSEDERLPSNICTPCVNKLMKIYNFRKQCRLNESLLRILNDSAPVVEHKKKLAPVVSYKQEPVEDLEEGYDEDDFLPTKFNVEDFYMGGSQRNVENLASDDSDNNEHGAEETANSDAESEEGTYVSLKDLLRENYNSNEVSAGNEESPTSALQDVKEDPDAPRRESVKCESESGSSSKVQSSEKNVNRKKLYSIHYICDTCKKTFANLNEVNDHKAETKHYMMRRKYMCKVCNVPKTKIIEHLRIHTREKPYQCEHCDQAFSIQSNLNRHISSHTGVKKHICETCGKAFTRKSSLELHCEMSHADENDTRPNHFLCTICGSTFFRSGSFYKHQKEHHGETTVVSKPVKVGSYEKPYGCEHCGKYFRTRALLKQHSYVHGEKSFVCAHCGKAFSSKSYFIVHTKLHSGLKPYKCTVCQKSFALKNTLDSHMLLHTGLKPYSCTICPKKFTQGAHLTSHMRTHNGERPYGCTYCEKAFAIKGNLTVHIRTHTGERPYVCKICGKGFHDSSSRKKHLMGHTQVKI